MAITPKENLVRVTKRGPTVGGRKPLLALNDESRSRILKNVQKEWKQLLKLHFQREGTILDGKVIEWKPLSERYLKFKENKGLLTGILEAETPTLLERYQKGIKFNPRNFQISISFPILITGKRDTAADFGTAEIHQLGRVKRRIGLKDFKKIATNKVREGILQNG